METSRINCPSCAGDVPVATKAARVAACPYCGNTLIVNRIAVELLGKMSLLTQTPSCLAVGWRARCLDREIVALGRIQYRYHSGLWDEWWIRFLDDGSTAWISQDEGEYMLERPLGKITPPDWNKVQPGDKFRVGKFRLWIEEKDEATMAGMEGELPIEARPEQPMRYLELTDNRIKLTIEYFADGSFLAFQGRYLKPGALEAIDDAGTWSAEWPTDAYPPPLLPSVADPSIIQSEEGLAPQSVNCPSCGGSVQVRDAELTVMVVCAFCDAALDVSVTEAIRLLYQSQSQQRQGFPIQIGAVGTINGVTWMVLGRVGYREDDPTGIWTWDELQLFNPEKGYAFLSCEDGHWMLFKPLRHRVNFDPRTVHPKQSVRLEGQTYKVFERSRALIEYVEGELTWVARIGDKLGYMDAIRPPYMLSAEWTESEMEWTSGRYLPCEEVCTAFSLEAGKLRQPSGVAPAQPFYRSGDQTIRAKAGLAAAVLILSAMIFGWIVTDPREVHSTTMTSADYLSERGYVSEPFDVPRGNHIYKLQINSDGVYNSWVDMSIAFLDEDENVVLDADAIVESYSGTEGGESWSEGSKHDYTLIRLRGPNTYRLNVFGGAGTWSRRGDRESSSGPAVTLKLYQDVMPIRFYLFGAIVALLYPMKEFGRGLLFEQRRWPSDDDDDD